MSVDSTTRKQSFAMDGETVDFTFTFDALRAAPTDIKCLVINAAGTRSTLAYTTDYSVVVNVGGSGGVVTVEDAQSATDTLFVYRDTTNTQESDYEDYNQFPAATVETDLDRRTLMSQELEDDISRAIKANITSDLSDMELPTPSVGKALVWSTTAGGLTNSTYNPDGQVDNAESFANIALNAASTASSAQLAASTSATLAASSATVAQTAADTMPAPTTGSVGDNIRVAADNESFEFYNPNTVSTLTVTTQATISLLDAAIATAGTLFVSTKATITTLSVTTIHLADAGKIVLDTAPAVSTTGTGQIAVMSVSANTIGIGSALHLQTDGTWIEADADGVATMPCQALALETGTGIKQVLFNGFLKNAAWAWSTGTLLYASATVGTITQTAPAGSGEQVQVLGIAMALDTIYFNPSSVLVEIV